MNDQNEKCLKDVLEKCKNAGLISAELINF